MNPKFQAANKQEKGESSPIVAYTPPAYGIVLEFQCEGSSCLHGWISGKNQEFLQEYVEKAGA